MATINTVSGIHTPNEGRVIWNDNFTAVNTEVEGLSTTIGAVGGSIVGTTEVQVLENKTISSSYRGGNNTISVSRRDLESTAFFLVTSDSGSVSNMDVSAASQYSLQLLGDNGIDTYVTSNVLYIRNSATCILNETSQKLGVGVASVTGGNVAEFGGNVLVSGLFGAGSHTAAASAEVHLKSSSPELRIETTSSQGSLSYYGDGDTFVWTADFTAGTEYLDLRYNGTQIAYFDRSNALTLTQDITFSKVAGAHTIVGDLDVQGTLTAGGLVATATDVIINNGPVTISGGWSFIADGAIEHDKLVTTSGGYIMGGAVTTGIPTFFPVTYGTGASEGDISVSTAYGDMRFYFVAGTMKLDYFEQYDVNTIIGGTSEAAPYGLRAYTCDSGGDITFTRNGTALTFDIDSGVITNTHINASAAIDMDKTAFAVNISGIVMNGNTLELAGPKDDILFRDIPVGTIISYAGDASVLSGSVEDEVIPGWLHCNGWQCSLIDYPALYNALGSAWGGAGYLPDLRGAFLRGVDVNRGLDPDYASRTGGGSSVKVGSGQTDELKAHQHELANNWAANIETGGSFIGGFKNGAAGYPDTQDTGGNETRPVNYAVIYLIKY